MDEVREEMIKEYEEYLLDLANNNSKEIFTNGGIRHASVLMSVLLKNTKECANIFSEGFRPDIIQNPYLEELLKYTADKNKSLRILLESDKYIHEGPLEVILQERERRNADEGIIEVRVITKEDKEHIFKQLKCKQCNFAVFDNKMYRFEYDPKNYKAYGSFNHENNSQYLLKLFDAAFENGALIN